MQQDNGQTVLVDGRIVWTAGDLFKGKGKIDDRTKQPVMDQKTGLQVIEYGFGLAVPKSVFNQLGEGQPGYVWTAMQQEAMKLYPSGQIPPQFAWKYKDGDSVDHNGQSFANRAGHAGHLILACTTRIPIKYFRFENGQNFQINEGIKCGDYVKVQLTVKGHPAIGQGKPGLYLNPGFVQFLGFGEAIVNTPTGDAIFGTNAPQVPQGASATPMSTPGMIAPTNGFAQPGGFPAPQAAAPTMAPGPVAPNWNVVPTIHHPGQPAAAPPMMNQPPAVGGFPPPPGAGATPSGFPPPPGFGGR